MPILKIGLDDRTHREFKVWCASNCMTMNGAVVELIQKQCGIVAVKNKIPESCIATRPVGFKIRVCTECGKEVEKWALTHDNKVICQECAAP